MKQVYQRLSKYRINHNNDDNKGGTAISRMLANSQINSQIIHSPSPTTILKSVNNSGSFMCRPAPPTNNSPQNDLLTYHEAAASSRMYQDMEYPQLHNLDNLNETITVNLYSSNNHSHEEIGKEEKQFVGYIIDNYEQQPTNSSYSMNKEEDNLNIGMSNCFNHDHQDGFGNGN